MARKSETTPEKGEKKTKRNADGTKKPGRLKQMVEVFKYTQEIDRSTLPLMLVALVVSMLVGVMLTVLIFDSPWYGIFMGLAVGILVAMMILARKAERAAFSRIKGQPGAALAAMQSIRRGWNVDDEPVQIDPRSQKMLFRASGRAGIAIVAEDSSSTSMKLLEKERRSIRRVLQHDNVPVHQIVVGDSEGEVPLHKLPTHMQRMKKQLTKDEAAQVTKRLNALQRSLRQSIPKGVDPMRARPNRKAMRGR
jgi:F0F1-type ATP synthase assembly protein I